MRPFVLALLAIMLSATSAWAQPSASEAAARDRLIDDSVAARDRNDHGAALALAQRAGEIRMTPSLRQFIAEELAALGRHVEALVAARQCESDAESDTRARFRREVLRECRGLQRTLQRSVADVVIVPPASVPAGFRVTLQGQEVRSELWNVPYPVMPGAVRVEATATGQEFHAEQSIAAGETFRVRIELHPAPAPVEPPPAPAPVVISAPVVTPTPAVSAPPVRPSRPLTPRVAPSSPGAGPWIVGGVGVAMLGGAVATFVLEQSAREDYGLYQCRENTGAGSRDCVDPAALAVDERRDTLRVVNNALFFGGLAAVTGATVWYLVARLRGTERPASAWNLQFAPTPAGGVAALHGSF
jgi:hypothetical protein